MRTAARVRGSGSAGWSNSSSDIKESPNPRCSSTRSSTKSPTATVDRWPTTWPSCTCSGGSTPRQPATRVSREGSVRSVLQTALRPRWWPRHLLLVVIVAGFCFLGHWQWDVSVSPRGSLQNTLYAFQWWAMALIVIYGWWRLLYEEAHPERRPRPAGGAGEPLESHPGIHPHRWRRRRPPRTAARGCSPCRMPLTRRRTRNLPRTTPT